MTTILITGSQGLIGSELQAQLKNSNIVYELLDIKFDEQHQGFGNILDKPCIKEKIKKCDGVIHLAAVSRVISGEKNPDLCWETNVTGTANVLEAAAASDRKPWVIYASSREVYGQQETLPVAETAHRHDVNIYGKSKIAAEDLVTRHQDKLNTLILRFSNVYGHVDDHHDRVIPAFCRAAAFGDIINIEGGDNIFDFTYVKDVVNGIIKAVKCLIANKTLPTIHFTSGEPCSLLELANLAISLGDPSTKIQHKAPRNFDVSRFYGDPTRAETVLNWKHKTSLNEGLYELIGSYKNQAL